jgi:hypothetical protein
LDFLKEVKHCSELVIGLKFTFIFSERRFEMKKGSPGSAGVTLNDYKGCCDYCKQEFQGDALVQCLKGCGGLSTAVKESRTQIAKPRTGSVDPPVVTKK